MLKWFRTSGSDPEPVKTAASGRRSTARKPVAASRPAASRAAKSFPDSVVVTEGNEASDWALWEDSMTALDSQMQGLRPSARVHVRDSGARPREESDAWAKVGKNRDL